MQPFLHCSYTVIPGLQKAPQILHSALSYFFMSCNFMSCIFRSCIFSAPYPHLSQLVHSFIRHSCVFLPRSPVFSACFVPQIQPFPCRNHLLCWLIIATCATRELALRILIAQSIKLLLMSGRLKMQDRKHRTKMYLILVDDRLGLAINVPLCHGTGAPLRRTHMAPPSKFFDK